jgi:fatty-acid peroxygenase
MMTIPRDRAPDSTLALLSDGYLFVSKRCRRHGSDWFETRLMMRKVVCMMGEEAARVFYEPDRFTRRGAIPLTALLLLQDVGSAATLDGAAHRWRKQMFMSLMGHASVHHLTDAFEEEWAAAVRRWQTMDEVVLFREVEEILCRAVSRWAGLPLDDAEARERTRELGAMIDGAGAVGPRNWRGMRLRSRTESWARGVVERIRAGTLAVPEGSPAHVVATHRGLDGELLEVRHAAVELINLLRPTVAVARYIVFAALALHEHRKPRTPCARAATSTSAGSRRRSAASTRSSPRWAGACSIHSSGAATASPAAPGCCWISTPPTMTRASGTTPTSSAPSASPAAPRAFTT